MLKLQSLDKWAMIGPGEGISLPGSPLKARQIRLFLNSLGKVRVDATWYDTRPVPVDPTGQEEYNIIPEVNGRRGAFEAFLCIADGYQAVEFSGVVGDVEIQITAGNDDETYEVWYYTPDGESIGVRYNEQTLTRIAARRERNADVEWAQYQAQRNAHTMMAKMQESFAEQLKQIGGRIVAVKTKGEDGGEKHNRAAGGDSGGDKDAPGVSGEKPEAAGEKSPAKSAKAPS